MGKKNLCPSRVCWFGLTVMDIDVEPVVEEGVETGPYDPFKQHVATDSDRSFLKNYDRKYAEYIKQAENRVGYQLALRYFQDANPPLGKLVTSLQGHELVLLDTDPQSPLHYLFACNCVPHINVSTLATTTLNPAQILVLTTNSEVSAEDIQKVGAHAHGGGLIISFNKGITILEKAFPGIFTSKNGETTLDKKINLAVEESEDKNLFLGLDNAGQRGKAARFIGCRRFDVVPGAQGTQVLVAETPDQHIFPGREPPKNWPLAAKVKVGNGDIFHFLHVGTNVSLFSFRCCMI